MVEPGWEERRRLLTQKSLEARGAGREGEYLILSSLVELGEWRDKLSGMQETLEKETEHLLKETKHLATVASELSRRLAELETRVHEEAE
ncbi:MAG TPA: hypothetical protein VGC53_01090 [Vicinamibacteria bacterium]|jgi:hypothetical protein